MKTSTFELSAIVTCLLMLSGTGLPVANAQTSQPNTTNTYPEELVEVFTESCVSSAVDSGLTAEPAEFICGCSIEEFQNRYTLEEFINLTQQTHAGTIPEVFQEVTSSCVVELMSIDEESPNEQLTN
ncbi:MAG: hypothetical protein SAJ37_21100 [Oscillatoria sp. PMC 1068.18]|nr:hypothetical protein [Oscillatoria sp. PMC 1076.18]MEC4991240.1 hypothetical protein [Oscillatoria sp. PMC 1068.18]